MQRTPPPRPGRDRADPPRKPFTPPRLEHHDRLPAVTFDISVGDDMDINPFPW